MERARKRLFNIICIICGCVFLLIFLLNTFYPIENNSFEYLPIIMIIGSAILILFFININKIIYNLDEKRLIIIASACFLLIAVIQVIFISKFDIITYYDEKHLYSAAIDIKNGDTMSNMDYFSNWYPFQMPITLIMAGIFKLCDIVHISNYKLVLVIINTIIIDLIVLLLFKFAGKLYNIKKAVILLILTALNPSIYIYSIYFYTDMPAMLCIVLSIYLYHIFNKHKNNKKIKYIALILLGISAFIGYKIRATVIIIVLAIVVHMFFTQKLKAVVKSLSVILIIFVLGSIAYKPLEKKFLTDEIIGLPASHWIHMGLNIEEKGQWSNEDRILAAESDDYNERKKIINDAILSRIKENGLSGNARLILDKIRVTWTESLDLFPQKHMNHYSSRLYQYVFGQKSMFITYYGQIYKSALFFFVVISIFKTRRKSFKSMEFLNIIFLLGFFTFYMIWECKARYILLAYPALMLTSLNGLDFVSFKAGQAFKRIDKFHINTKRIMALGMIFLLAQTLIVSIVSFNSYTKEDVGQYSWVSKQDRSRKSIGRLLKGDKLVQTFETQKSFNTLEIYVNKTERKFYSSYTISLFDISADKEIKSWEINTENIGEDKIKLDLDEVVVTEKKEYAIIITSDDATEQSALEIQTYYYPNYDVFPNGELSLNDTELDYTDMTFTVYNYNKAPLMSKVNYTILTLSVLTFEIITVWVFYRIMKRGQRTQILNNS